MSRTICLGFATLMAALSVGFSGCCFPGGGGGGGGAWGFIDSFMEEQVACLQTRVWARRAFHLQFGHCERVHADHFQQGFEAGYCDVCEGRSGQVPALPPEKYWGFRYRNAEGAEMQNAWFSGFEAGAKTAFTDGSGSFQEIQMSRQIEEAMLAAEELEYLHSGIEREYIVDMAPVTEGPSQSTIPQTNVPFINTNVPVITSPVPSNSAGSNQPLPVQIVPAQAPIVPGQQR